MSKPRFKKLGNIPEVLLGAFHNLKVELILSIKQYWTQHDPVYKMNIVGK